MADEIQELFSNADYCRREICNIRKAISSTTTTQESFDSAYRTLSFMLIYAPPELLTLVNAQMIETQTRERFFVFRGLKI